MAFLIQKLASNHTFLKEYISVNVANIFNNHELISHKSIHFNCLQWTLWYCSANNKWKKFLKRTIWDNVMLLAVVRPSVHLNSEKYKKRAMREDNNSIVATLWHLSLPSEFNTHSKEQFAEKHEYLFNTDRSTLSVFVNDFITLSHRWFLVSQHISRLLLNYLSVLWTR